jgi:ADP-ribose pyrophosphatase YjhB (NUDIX family)
MTPMAERTAGYDCTTCGYERFINSKPAVMGVLRRANNVLLVQDGSDTKWDLPGGFLNDGEDPVLGLRRECSEELGIDVGDVTLLELVVDRYRGESWSFTAAYIVLDYSGAPSPCGEIIAATWFELADLPALRYDSVGVLLETLRRA